MKILFQHVNFPAQFKALAPALAAQGHEVHALTMREGLPAKLGAVTIHQYRPQRSSTPKIHPWLIDFETKVIRGEACMHAAQQSTSLPPPTATKPHGRLAPPCRWR